MLACSAADLDRICIVRFTMQVTHAAPHQGLFKP
jgi:hypothetical protein